MDWTRQRYYTRFYRNVFIAFNKNLPALRE
jgi:hypothetical protein